MFLSAGRTRWQFNDLQIEPDQEPCATLSGAVRMNEDRKGCGGCTNNGVIMSKQSAETTVSTVDKLLRVVREIEPIVRQHAAEAERERRLATPVSQAMQRAGLYRLWRPKAFGGFELDPVSGFRVLEEIARIDSAAGWNLMVSASFDVFGAWFDDATAREIFGSDAVLAGAFNPPRQAVPVDGGFRVSGRTPFGSGAHHATSLFGFANIFDEGTMRMGPAGLPDLLFTAFPAKDAEIIDNWNTIGMRGTGSHDISLDDVFIPSARAVPWQPLETPGTAYRGPLYRFTIWPATTALGPVAIGVARAAIEDTIALATSKTPAYTMTSLKDRAVVQSKLAQAEAKLASSRAFLYHVMEEVWDEALAAKPITVQLKGRMQLASTNAVLESAKAVDLIYDVVGASGVREEHPFARYFRDVHVISQHGFINSSKLESVGQIMLGLQPEWPFFMF
jgi:alkylation response protein AidB-like acyl-CoA dehydrogenase